MQLSPTQKAATAYTIFHRHKCKSIQGLYKFFMRRILDEPNSDGIHADMQFQHVASDSCRIKFLAWRLKVHNMKGNSHKGIKITFSSGEVNGQLVVLFRQTRFISFVVSHSDLLYTCPTQKAPWWGKAERNRRTCTGSNTALPKPLKFHALGIERTLQYPGFPDSQTAGSFTTCPAQTWSPCQEGRRSCGWIQGAGDPVFPDIK